MAKQYVVISYPCPSCGKLVNILRAARCRPCFDWYCARCLKEVAPDVYLCRICVLSEDYHIDWYGE